MKKSALMLALALLGLAAAACTSGTEATRSGRLELVLTSRFISEGAVLLELAGPAIDSLTVAHPSYRLFSASVGADRLRLAIVGNLSPGTLLTFAVPDVSATASYQASLIEVASTGNVLREPLTGYSLTVERPSR